MSGVRKDKRHGLAGTLIYKIWVAMKDRCYNPRNEYFDCYGGRGIRVCDQWVDSFATFMDDMGPRPDGLTLERLHNDKDYTPGNCVWATKKAQARNRRTNRSVTIDGVTRPVVEWCELRGILPKVVYQRINQYHWSPEDAVNTPMFPKGGSGPTRRMMEK